MNNKQMTPGTILALLGMSLLVLAVDANAAPTGRKVNVCHATGGPKPNIINVSDNALLNHIAHGDWLVTAPMCDDIVDNDCDGAPDDPADDDANCVIENSAGWTCENQMCIPPGDITIVKNTVGGDGTFNYVSATLGNFPLTTTAGTASTNVESLVPGNYDVSETVPVGWDLTASSCNDGSTLPNIGVSSGESVTCTFTNTKRGDITIVKNTVGADGTFQFTSTTFPAFNLTTVGNTASTFFDNLLPGTYDVAETVPSGWELTSATCSDGSAPGSIMLDPGESVICTFTNTNFGTLKVIKNSGSNGMFGFTGSAGIGGAFQITTAGAPAAMGMDSFNLLTSTTYDVSESLNPDFDFGSASCVLEGGGATGTPGGTGVTGIVVEASKTTTCTFTNSLKPGALTVIKNSDADGSFDFTGDLGNFTLNTTGAPSATDMQTFSSLDATTDVDLTETLNPAFDFVSAVCLLEGGGATGAGGPAVTGIDIEPGKTTTCTFTNMQKLGTLKVVKNSDADGSFDFTGDVGNFTLNTTGAPSSTAMQTFASLDPLLTYDVTETLNPDFDFVSATCLLEGGGGTGSGGPAVTGVVLEPGKTTTCTFTNDLKPGSITVVKNSDADGSFDFTGDLGNFTLNTTGAPAATDQQTFLGLDATATFDVTETPNPGFDFNSAVCTLQGGGATGTPGGTGVTGVGVEPGKTTTCTFTNDVKTGSLKVIKNADADGSFDFTGDLGNFTLNTTGAPSSTAMQTFASLDPLLTYDVTETLNPDFDFGSASCVLEGGGATGTPSGTAVTGIVIEGGKTTTCTYTNTVKPGSITVVKNSGADGSFDFTGDLGNFTLNTVGAPAATDQQTFASLDASTTYDIVEAANVDFDFVSVACTLQGGGATGTPGASTVTGVGVEPGKTTTCAFTNVALDNAPTVVSTTPADAATDVSLGTNITINFSESVNATTGSFTIECAAPGNFQSYALSASPATSFTLNPNADLPATTLCTVTVIAAQVTDADAADPPDNMASNFVFTFTTTANSPPVANQDDYTTGIGNTNFALVAATGPTPFPPTVQVVGNILTNDTDPDSGDTLSTTAETVATTMGGSATIDANGRFVYTPAAGFPGSGANADSFDYEVCDDDAVPLCDNGTVTIEGSNIVWYVDDSSPNNPGTGTAGDPFQDLSSAAGPSLAGETIFVFAGTQTTGITLKTNQPLIGEGVALVVNTITLVGTGPRPVISTPGGAIQLGMSNTIRGIDISGSTTGITGNGFGTLTTDTIAISTTGGAALDLNDGAGSATFDSVSSSGSTTQGIDLSAVSGMFSLGGGSISGSTDDAFQVFDSTATIGYTGTISAGSALAVDIDSQTANSVSLSGAIASTGEGISLTDNASGTINLSGGMSLSTGANPGISATGGGTLNICDDTNCSAAGGIPVTNTLQNGSATALNVSGVDIGSEGLTFRLISSNGGPAGIVLNNTGTAGGLTVTGDGSVAQGGNDTGGIIQNKSGDGVSLTSTRDVTLQNMTIGDTAATAADGPDATNNIVDDGIDATGGGVTNLMLQSVTIARTGGHGVNAIDLTSLMMDDSLILNAGDGQEEHGLNLDELRGDNFVADSLFDAFNETGIEVVNASGTVDLTISNTRFQDNKATVGNAGEEAILLEALGDATIVVLVTGASVFDDIARQAIQALSIGATSMIHLTVQNSSFVEHASGDGIIIMNPDGGGSGNVTVRGNTFTDDTFGPFAIIAKNDSSGTLDATIQSNTVDNMNMLNVNHDNIGGAGAANGTSRILIGGATPALGNTNNVGTNNISIDIIATETGPVGTGPDLSLTIQNNTTTQPQVFAFTTPGLRIDMLNQSRVNANILDNAFQDDSGGSFSGIEFKEQDTSVANLEGFAGGTAAAAATFIDTVNPASSANTFVPSHDNNIGSGTATLPTPTTLPSP